MLIASQSQKKPVNIVRIFDNHWSKISHFVFGDFKKPQNNYRIERMQHVLKQPGDLVFTHSKKSSSLGQVYNNGMMIRENEWQSNPNLGFWNNRKAPGKAYYRSNYLEKKITVELGDANVSARNGIAPSHSACHATKKWLSHLAFWKNCNCTVTAGKAYCRSNYLEKKITVELGDKKCFCHWMA